MAVFGAGEFDAATAGHDAVRFSGAGTKAATVTLCGWPLRYALDQNGDAQRDMVYTFLFGDTGFGCADILAGRFRAEVVASLTGQAGDIWVVGQTC